MNLVIHYFEKTCLNKSGKTAVICQDKNISYMGLLENSKKIGSFFLKYVSNNEPVIVFMDKGIDALESFFGILYAGGCYSLTNPDFPDIRIRQIKDILQAKTVVTDTENYDRAKEIFVDCNVFHINELLKEQINEEKLAEIQDRKLDMDPVYINFTSGSTGVPKGVVVSNRSIIDFIEEFTLTFHINENDVIGNQAPFDFDVSVKDIYSTIFVGATLLIIPKAYFSNPAVLLDYIVDNHVTTLIWAVTALCLITTFHGLDYKIPKEVNKVLFSGEVMPLKHLNIWIEKLPEASFVNVYGPTEITCNCTYHIIDREKTYQDSIPIGKAFQNEKVFLLDERNEIIDCEDKTGEICVSGSCLSLGYYNNQEQTDKHFYQNPINKYYFERIYRTGDLGKYDTNGELVFCGRKDFQIKYMGHRIELEEIDRMVLTVPEVIRVCTVFEEKKSKVFCFYIGDIDSRELKMLLQKDLPVYMVPTKLIQVEELPMTKNGKIDRKELLERYKGRKS